MEYTDHNPKTFVYSNWAHLNASIIVSLIKSMKSQEFNLLHHEKAHTKHRIEKMLNALADLSKSNVCYDNVRC